VIDSGFTITNSLDFVGGQHFEGAMAYLIETTATAKNPIWSSMDVGATASGTVASFLAAAAGGGDTTTVRNRTMMGIG
jgi:hypothetical protein